VSKALLLIRARLRGKQTELVRCLATFAAYNTETNQTAKVKSGERKPCSRFDSCKPMQSSDVGKAIDCTLAVAAGGLISDMHSPMGEAEGLVHRCMPI
jgi:hypothetical protein